MRRGPDSSTPDMFEIPIAVSPVHGGLDISGRLRHLLSELLKASPLSRYQVAARMSELTGHDISKHQLDAWTADSRDGWRFPLEYMPAFEAALETHAITGWLAELRGCRVLVGADALLAELGRIERAKQDLLAKEKVLKRRLGNA